MPRSPAHSGLGVDGEHSQHPGRDTRNDRDPFFSPGALLRLAPDGARWLGALVLGVP